MTRAIPLAALALAFAAPVPAFAQAADVFSAKLAKLDPLRRDAVLRRAVLDSGNYCKRASDGRAQTRWKNLIMWTVRCTPGGDYAVFLGPSQSVQVGRCDEAKKLGLPLCRMPPAPAAAPAKRK